jgi:DNA-binding transcriptional MerR regulator
VSGGIPIGELSRRTGVTAPVLRMWERRYGIPSPARSDGRQRRYSAEDERRVRDMRARIADGMRPAAAARAVALDDPGGVAPVLEPPVAAMRAELRAALDEFDEPRAHATLDAALARLSLTTALAEVVMPYLRDLGSRWEGGAASIAQEHFATTLVRGRLLALARNWGAGAGRRAVLACPPGEFHDLGLIAFGLALREAGWRITLLGANSPAATIAEAADAVGAELVVVAAMDTSGIAAIADDLAAVALRKRVLLGGPGADPALAATIGAGVLPADPVAGAAAAAASP